MKNLVKIPSLDEFKNHLEGVHNNTIELEKRRLRNRKERKERGGRIIYPDKTWVAERRHDVHFSFKFIKFLCHFL